MGHAVLDQFSPLPGRDAYAAIRGFVYQVERTIQVWLDLPPSAALYCEAGEDVDRVGQALAGGADAEGTKRLLEQIKFRKDTISLRSPEVRESLANSLATCERNAGQELRFRFFTNASPVAERGVRFPRGLTGIAAWEATRLESLDEQDLSGSLAVLRALLGTLPDDSRDQGVPVRAGILAEFIDGADDATLVSDLVGRFEFSTGNPPVGAIRVAIERRLQELEYARGDDEARQFYETLFVSVMHLLSRPGEKRLDAAVLRALVQEGTLAAADRAMFLRIQRYLAEADERMATMQRDLATVVSNTQPDQVAERFLALVRDAGLLAAPGLGDAPIVSRDAPPRPDRPPTRPAYLSPRPALLETVATALAQGRWVALTGLAGMGKTQLARELFLSWPDTRRRWISAGGHDDNLGARLEGQLLVWLRDLAGDMGVVASYAAGQPDVEELLAAIAATIGDEFLLVLDDLPDAPAHRPLTQHLVAIATAVAGGAGRVFSTGQHGLPNAVLDILGDTAHMLVAPPFGDDDTRTVLIAAGAPPGLTNRRFIAFLGGLTGGHPALLAATLRWLRTQGWAFEEDRLDRLIGGEPVATVRRETRRAIRRLLEDGQTRALLDRLSLVGAAFRVDTVTALGAVDPPIDRPEERLHDLVGAWVQQLDGPRYEVSPLLRETGEEYLAAATRREVHGATAHVELRGGTIDATDAFRICTHLLKAGEWFTLAAVYIQLLHSASTAEHGRILDWARYFFRPGEAWPVELPRSTRILVRAAQIRRSLLTGERFADYDEELDRLIAGPVDGDDERLAVGFAHFQAGVMRDDLPAATVAHHALAAARVLRHAGGIWGNALPESPHAPEGMFWIAFKAIRGIGDIRALLDMLRALPTAERRAVVAASPGPESALNLADFCYGYEGDKPAADRDWLAVLGTIDELGALGEESGVLEFVVAARRARAIVVADHLGQADGALALLAATPDGDRDSHRFTIAYTEGRVMLSHGRPEDAFRRFATALLLPPGDGSWPYHLDALVHGMVAASRIGRWDEARRWGAGAIRLALRRGRTPPDVAELLGELAWVHWQAGDRARACGALHGALRRLAASQTLDRPRFNEAAWKVGHLLGWFAGIASTGQPPATVRGGEPYVAPYSGLLYRSDDALGREPQEHGLAPLLVQLAMIASTFAPLRLARRAYEQASRLAEEEGRELLAATADSRRSAMEAYLGDFDSAIAAAIRGGRAFAIAQALQSRGHQVGILTRASSLEDDWRALTDRDRRFEDALFFRSVILPAFVRLLADPTTDERALEELDRLDRSIVRVETAFQDPAYWRLLVTHMRRPFEKGMGHRRIQELLSTTAPDDNYQRVILYAVLARVSDARPADVASAQAVVLIFCAEGSDTFVQISLARWLTRHWRDEVAMRSFRLTNPILLRDDLMALDRSRATVAGAARLMLTAQVATGSRFALTVAERLWSLSRHDVGDGP